MCGIAGYVGTSAERDRGGIVRMMTGAMCRRGPDAEGHEEWPAAALGHRRLSIFDLSEAGRQPMTTPDGRVAVVFNGAIYNFQQLRSELQPEFEFRTRTDTEVLLHGYVRWGIDGLVRRLRGMFAFALWDERERQLVLVRDRLGVKPLVYAQLPGRALAFASTVRALRLSVPQAPLDRLGVLEFLEFGFVPDEQAIYAGMSKLMPATILTWSERGVSTRRYWEPPHAAEPGTVRFGDACDAVESLLLDATRLRLFADVPVGSLLSGGVDSSLVCWAAARAGADITAFTVGVPNDPSDETEAAAATARQLGLRHEILPLTSSDASGSLDLVKAYAEPFACSSALAMLSVSRLVKSRATCLLTGDGGDDVFLGYPEHLHLHRAQRLARTLPGLALPLWQHARSLVRGGHLGRRARHFLDYALGGLPAVAAARDGLPYYEQRGLLGERLAGDGLARRQQEWSHESAMRVLAEFLAYDRTTRFTGEYLTKVDGATMHFALEARSPFLDHVLWEYAAALPFSLRLRRGALKAVLRAIASRRIGPAIARGEKRGFTVPVQRWLAQECRPLLRETFAGSLLQREGLIREDRLMTNMDRDVSDQVPLQIWRLFILEHWLRHERSGAAAAAA